LRRISQHTLLAQTFKVSLIGVFLALYSCVPGSSTASKTRRGGSTSTNNGTFSVAPNFGRYFDDNPIILSGNPNLDNTASLSPFLNNNQKFITTNQFLIAPCAAGGTEIDSCLEVRDSEVANYTTATENRWGFNVGTTQFLEVQTFGNMRDITNKFMSNLEFSLNLSIGFGYTSAIPTNLFNATNKAFWYQSGLLKGYSNCGVDNNAFYDSAGQTVCLGNVTTVPPIFISSDPTITWHEMGHAFNQISMNMRQRAFSGTISTQSSLGYLFYDEAGSINEGVADFYSQFMNNRTHFAEWGLGRYLIQSRPMSEDDALHAPGIDTSTEGRLAYPAYVTYDPNEPEVPFEDVHYAGQIISHFLTAFKQSIEDTTVCGLSSDQAMQITIHLLTETLAELGDQTATGSGVLTTSTSAHRVNLNPDEAIEWISKNNPINFRRFIQTYSKYFIRSLGNSLFNMCGSSAYSRDDYEKLVDSYGLLLFKTYNEDDNHMSLGHSGVRTVVTPTNRVKSEFIKKDLLILDNRENSASAFIIDNQSDIKAAVEGMILSGQVSSISSQIDGNFAFNNGNAQISPGEVVGVALNLLNSSNSTMAGVHLLANDWDHAKNGALCNNLGDNFPLASEGAADLTSGEGTQGGCDYTTRYNGKNSALEPNESLAPVCFVELADTDATKWVVQDRLRSSIGMSKQNCLGGEDSTDDCFIRAIKGADHAFYSKLNPQQTWAESLQTAEGIPTFNTSNVIFFEVSPDIPPGTTFNCRMRARFTNCEDCYHDELFSGDDYLDYEYAGAKPFKLINFKFTVID
jgi:hypothetical protein